MEASKKKISKNIKKSRVRIEKAFLLTFAFFLLIFLLIRFLSIPLSGSYDKKVLKIEEKMERLQALKKEYEWRAVKHENKVKKYVQYNKPHKIKNRKNLAEENKKIAIKIDKDICKLEKTKNKLIKKHNKSNQIMDD